MSVGSMTRFGMVAWLVRDQTVSAVTDMPGVLAISLKGGACLFGDAASVLQDIVAARTDILRIGETLARIANVSCIGEGYDWLPLV